MEKDLDSSTILVFRKIAHLRVERAKKAAIVAQVAAAQSESSWNSWTNWIWGTSQPTSPKPVSHDDDNPSFSEEDWGRLTSAIEIEKEETVDDTPFTLKTLFGFQIQSASLSLLDAFSTSFVHGHLTNLTSNYRLYPKTQVLAFEVATAILSTPEGALMTTVYQSEEQSTRAIAFEYTMLPQKTSVAARIQLKTSSTYVTFRPEAFLALKQFLAPTKQLDVSVFEAQAVAQIKKVKKNIRIAFVTVL